MWVLQWVYVCPSGTWAGAGNKINRILHRVASPPPIMRDPNQIVLGMLSRLSLCAMALVPMTVCAISKGMTSLEPAFPYRSGIGK